MIYSQAEIDKLWKASRRAYERAIAAEDAGKPSAKLDAALDRANAAYKAARDGVPDKKHAARIEREIGEAVLRDYEARTGTVLKVQREGNVFYAYRWRTGVAGDAGLPELIGPFKTDAAAFKRVLEMAR